MRYWTPFTWKMYLRKRPHTKAFVFDTRKYCSSAERDSASMVIDDCCFSSGWLVNWRWYFLGFGAWRRIRRYWEQFFVDVFVNWDGFLRANILISWIRYWIDDFLEINICDGNFSLGIYITIVLTFYNTTAKFYNFIKQMQPSIKIVLL